MKETYINQMRERAAKMSLKELEDTIHRYLKNITGEIALNMSLSILNNDCYYINTRYVKPHEDENLSWMDEKVTWFLKDALEIPTIFIDEYIKREVTLESEFINIHGDSIDIYGSCFDSSFEDKTKGLSNQIDFMFCHDGFGLTTDYKERSLNLFHLHEDEDNEFIDPSIMIYF